MDKMSCAWRSLNRSRLKRAVLVLAAAFFLSASAVNLGAQWGMHFSGATYFDGNTFRNYENIADVIYQPYFSVYYDFLDDLSQYRLAYEGYLSVFSEYRDRAFQYHTLGINGINILSETGPALTWGIDGGKRINQPEYQFYDYYTLEGHAHLLFEKNSTWVLGVGLRYQEYEQLPEFSYLETTASLRANYYFQTKTTVIGLLTIGVKHFTRPLVSEELYYFRSGAGGSGNGRGRGYGAPQNNVGMMDSTLFVRVESERDNVAQMIGSLRIAQSLREKTGIALQGTLQRNPGLSGRVLAGQDFGYETDDALFDDPYSYESDELSAEITNIFPWGIQIKLGYDLQNKRYDRSAYDLSGMPLEGEQRTDRRQFYWLSLQKLLPLSKALRLALSLSYTELSNDSNDAYFNYTNSITSAGLEVFF